MNESKKPRTRSRSEIDKGRHTEAVFDEVIEGMAVAVIGELVV